MEETELKLIKKETNKYKLLSFVRYFGDSFFYPFFSLYLKQTKMLESKIGFILSITPIIAILSNPIYSMLCKNVVKTKKVLNIVTIVEGLLIFLISLTSNFYLISVLVLLVALFGSCHYGLLDSLTSVYANEKKINYSTIRMFGSIAYIIGTTLGGYIINYIGFKASFGLCFFLFALSGVFYYLIKPIDIKNVETTNKPTNRFDILKNSKYVIFAVFYALLMALTSSSDHFYSLYLEDRGVSAEQFGLVYSYFVGVEFITLLILTKVKIKVSTEVLLLISAFCLVTRSLCNYLYLPVIVVILITALRGIGYAIVLHTSFIYVVKIVGSEKGTFAIMLMTLINSLFVAIFENVNGNIIENHSFKDFYLFTTIIALIILVYAFVRYFLYRNENKQNKLELDNGKD